MRIGIKGKQVLGVTSIVGTVVVVLSVLHVARLARLSVQESAARAELLASAIFHRARELAVDGADPYRALAADPGLRSILEASLYSRNVTFAAIADPRGIAVAHADAALEGRALPAGGELATFMSRPALSQLVAVYSGQGRTLEFRQPLLLGNTDFGSIRIGISTLLIRDDLNDALRPAIATAFAALAISVAGAILLAQLLLRPIHVIRSGLTRLGRGEFDVRLDLPEGDEFGELGHSFNAVTAQLSAERSQMAGQVAHLESAVERLEDAVAIVNPAGEMLFANPAMRDVWPGAAAGTPIDQAGADHPLRRLVEETILRGRSLGPMTIMLPEGERLIVTHAVNDPDGRPVGVLIIARNLEYLSQVQSTIRYSRKVAALGRISAGVAHEVKNPLNAMMIHLELLRQRVAALARTTAPVAALAGSASIDEAAASPADGVAALEHVGVIAAEIRRLDQVVQGFLKFTRPEDLSIARLSVRELLDEVVQTMRTEAEQGGIGIRVECDDTVAINGDRVMLRQALLNLALNACQAMPTGGTLTLAGEGGGRHRGRVTVVVADTGVGIPADALPRIFDLYFTTKPNGSGIGLSMVFRTVQMHDGDIEIQSTPGAGTTFRILLPQA
jgi:signal transduction histidine kinase/HAMP domain-containing protein